MGNDPKAVEIPPQAETRQGNWVQTYTGLAFWPLDPRENEINILDIAHSLSNQCRFAGHCLKFYSVAEHSVHVSTAITQLGYSPRISLWGLMHDAAEAYLVDIPRPVKKTLPEYAVLEKSMMGYICRRFALDEREPDIVKEIDARMLATEAEQIMRRPPMLWDNPAAPLPGIRIEGWAPLEARSRFLARFNHLMREILL